MFKCLTNEHKVPYKEKSYDVEINFNVIYNFDSNSKKINYEFF